MSKLFAIFGTTSMLHFAALTVIPGQLVLADDRIEVSESKATPQLAAFYTIDSDGESVPDEPTVDVVSGDSKGPTRFVRRPVPLSKDTRIDWTRKPAESAEQEALERGYDRSEEYRCERWGFYYTMDGRCVVPMWSRPVPPSK